MTALQTAARTHPAPAYDVERIRADFPILGLEVEGKPLVYLDNAASSQMPRQVIDRLVRYQTTQHANVNRGVHYLSETATFEYEEARRKVQRFINAREDREVIFTSGTTDAINLVTHGYGRKFIGAGDEIILTTLEHHSNIVPWQMLAEEKGATIRVVPIDDAGELLLDEYEKLFNARTKFVGVMHVSNALGTINPVKRMIAFAHARGVPVLVDGAQAVPHLTVDVQELDCDFYAFSGHKMCGPTGIGILYGKASLLERMQPFKGGGDMILSVTFEKTTYNTIPHKFEAGTPPIAAAVGMGAAVDYLSAIGMDAIAAHEHELARLRDRADEQDEGRAHHRHRRAQGVGAVVHDRRRASARRRHAAQPGRHRGSHRAPLRAAGDAAVPRAGDLARVVRALQHDGRGRRARRRHPQRAEGVRANGRSEGALPGSDPRSQPQAAQLRRAAASEPPGGRPQSAVRGPHQRGARLDGDRIDAIAFEGESCAICKASASMMTVAVKGKSRADAETLIREFRDMATGKLGPDGLAHIGRLAVFAGVRDLPTRVKCAILPWHTLHAALNSVATTSTEAEDDPMHAPIGGA